MVLCNIITIPLNSGGVRMLGDGGVGGSLRYMGTSMRYL